MGLHKICKHKGRARDRCKHAWWGSFRGKRVSLAKWTNREITSKAEADKALDELTAAIRDGTFDERGLDPPPDNSPMTFGKFAEVYKQRHVLAKGLALSSTIDYRLKPLVERFGDRPIAEIKTADIDDFVADLKRPRVVNGLEGRRLTPASINRMRRGEMLALRFGDIDWPRRMITLRGATTKNRRTRLVPIGTARLLAVLGWRAPFYQSCGTGTGIRTPVPWLRTTCPDP